MGKSVLTPEVSCCKDRTVRHGVRRLKAVHSELGRGFMRESSHGAQDPGLLRLRLTFCYLAEFPLQEAIQGKDVEVE